jgi:hypothetical protein
MTPTAANRKKQRFNVVKQEELSSESDEENAEASLIGRLTDDDEFQGG